MATQKPRCKARRTNGQRCCAYPLQGADVCRAHGGAAPQVRAAAARRTAERKTQAALDRIMHVFGPNDSRVDPVHTLARLLAQSARRAEFYADLLEQQYQREAEGEADADLPNGVRALIGHKYGLTKDGDSLPIEEAVRSLVALEADERDRCAKYAKLALDVDLDERMVRASEQQVTLVADALAATLSDMGLSHGQQQEARAGVARRLRVITG